MLLQGYLFIFILMFVFWLVYLKIQLPNIVDLGWVIAIAGSGFILLYPIFPEHALPTLLLSVWAVRLGGFLWWTRLRKTEHDQRYQTISDNWKVSKSLGFLANYQFQGILAWTISLPFYFIAQVQYYNNYLAYLSLIIVMTGIIGETIADWQLYRFKQAGHGKVCDNGLWRYSMHPNYFFEWLTWLGFSVYALQASYGVIALISPALLFCIMYFITGPITDKQQLKNKGEVFLCYQKRTSRFFLWWTQ